MKRYRIDRKSYRQWRLTCPQSLLSPLSQIHKWLGATPVIETSLPAFPSLPESESVAKGGAARPDKRQRIDALGNAIQAALAVLSPSGEPWPRPHELFDYLKTSDNTRTITGVANGNRALLWIDDNGNEQTLTFPALTKRLDRLKQDG